jgi:hypothetical protein
LKNERLGLVDWAQEVEHLLSKDKTLSLNPSSAKKKKKQKEK